MAMFVNGLLSPFPTGTNPVTNATADLDGDGDLDLLFANYISDNVSVLFNNGAGVFTPQAPVVVGNGPRTVQAGNLDGDGDIDFIVSNYGGNSVSVLLNNGNGTFAAAVDVPVGLVPRSVALGDVDGDGDLDFVSANYQSNNVSVMLNNGGGAFSAATGSPIAVGTHPVDVVVADLDGDNDRDIAVTNNSNNNVSILLNNGSGTFTAAPTVATGTGPRGITAGDVDGDGDNDLVVVNFGANTLSILLNDGSGGFTAGAPLATQNNPYRVALGDLDGDGDLDIAATNSGSSSVNVFRNDGSGGFTPASGSPFAVGVSPGGLVLADFDGDGDRDLSTANFGSSTTSILRNTSAFYSVAAPSAALEGTPPGAGGELVFTITRTATSEAENVTYTVGGTATAGTDFTAPSGTASFAVGQATAQIHVAITPDAAFEPDETVTVTLASASGDGFINPAAAVGTILDDDASKDALNNVTGFNLFGANTGDFFLFHDVGGTRTLQTLGIQNNVVVAAQTLGAIGSEWTVDGAGNYDGDTDNDLLLHRDNAGVHELLLLKMQGNAVAAGVSIGSIGADWNVRGSGDFNHNGTTDILLDRAVGGTHELLILNMNNGVVQGGQFIAPTGPGWLVDDVRDFNGDGTADILQHRDVGDARNFQILDIQNQTVSATHVSGAFGNDWQIQGADDFNHDGTADVLVSRAVGDTIQLAVYEIHGGTVTAFRQLGAVGNDVQIDAVGDFNNDGTADIAFHRDVGGNRTLGTLEIHNFTVTAAHTLGVTGTDWIIQ